jgi:centromere protein I
MLLRMELTRQAGNDPPLVGLMRVYKDYYPDVIVGDVTSGKASAFMVNSISCISRLLLIYELASESRVESETC